MSVELFGGAASSGPCALDPGPSRPSAFSRGAADTFELRLAPLGALQRLRVSTDRRGSAWHLDYITVSTAGPGGEES